MLYRIRFVCVVLYLNACIDVVYGNQISSFKDLLDEKISLVDRLQYLNDLKEEEYHSYFSTEDLNALIAAYIIHENKAGVDFELHQEFMKDIGKSIVNLKNIPEEDNIKDSIRYIILKLFLNVNVNKDVLTPEQISVLAPEILHELDFYSHRPKKVQLRYLALKVLIKLNELSSGVRGFDRIEGRRILKSLFPHNSTLIANLNVTELFMIKNDEWDDRETIEEFIFNPVLLEDDGLYNECQEEDQYNFYKTESKTVLEDYEGYLLGYIRYYRFPVTDNLKKLLEKGFYNTQFERYKSTYMDLLTLVGAYEALIKIASDSSVDVGYRKGAIDRAVYILSKKSDQIYFKKVGDSLLKGLKGIVRDLNENKEFRRFAKEKIPSVQVEMRLQSDMWDPERVFFNPKISTENKIKYLNDMIDSGFYFLHKDLNFIIKVIKSEDIDVRLKSYIVTAMFFRIPETTLLIDELETDDMESVVFLYKIKEFLEAKYRGDIDAKATNKALINVLMRDIKVWKEAYSIQNIHEMYINQSYKFDIGEILLFYINGKAQWIDNTIRKKAIRASLDLLTKTKDFDTFSTLLLKALQRISSDVEESEELKSISDYILSKVNNEKSLLQDIGKDCALTMML